MRRASKAVRAEIQLVMYTTKKALGVCVKNTCPYLAVPEQVLCERHGAKVNANMKRYAARLKEKGIKVQRAPEPRPGSYARQTQKATKRLANPLLFQKKEDSQ